MKILGLTLLLICVSANVNPDTSILALIEASPVSSIFKGFMYGVQLDPTQSSSNACLNQIATTESIKSSLYQTFINSYKGLTDIYSFISVLRQFIDSYNQEINICKFPTLLNLVSTALTLSNVGEYVIKYIVKSTTYNTYLDDGIQAYMTGDYQAAGENFGKIFMGLTNFYI